MSTRPQTLSSAAGTIVLGTDIRLGIKAQGFGLPGVEPQWFEGAGDGRTWRGSRVLGRSLALPVTFRGADRAAVLDSFSRFSRVIAPQAGLTTLTVEIAGESWWVNVTRSQGGDFSWDTDTDGETILMLPDLVFEAEEPYWTRTDAESVVFVPEDVSAGLLTGVGSMVGMTVGSTTSLGAALVTNPGDVATPVLAVVEAPLSGFQLIGAAGELIEWSVTEYTDGADTDWIAPAKVTVDMANGTVVDEAGVNVYGGLNDVPVFWSLQPGDSTVTIQIDDADTGSKVTLYWNPRRWVLF